MQNTVPLQATPQRRYWPLLVWGLGTTDHWSPPDAISDPLLFQPTAVHELPSTHETSKRTPSFGVDVVLIVHADPSHDSIRGAFCPLVAHPTAVHELGEGHDTLLKVL